MQLCTRADLSDAVADPVEPAADPDSAPDDGTGIPPGMAARQASQLRDAGEHVPEVDVIATRSG